MSGGSRINVKASVRVRVMLKIKHYAKMRSEMTIAFIRTTRKSMNRCLMLAKVAIKNQTKNTKA